MTIPLNALKEICAVSIFLIGLLSVLAPLSVMNLSDSLFSIGNMMASGVLLAAGLVHQLPDSSAVLDYGNKFPWSTFIAGLTFIAVLILEESIHIMFAGGGGVGVGGEEVGGGGSGDTGCHGHDHNHQHNGSINNKSRGISDGGDYRRKRDKDVYHHHHHHHLNHSYRSHGEHETQPLMISPSTTQQQQQTQQSHHQPSSFTLDRSISACSETQRNNTHHHHDEHISQHLHGSILAASVLLLSLSIHSTLAGLSIGIAPKSIQVTSTAVAILAHKFFEGYALGSSMVTADMAVERIFVLGTMFALMAPLGIILGMSFTYHEENQDGSVDDDDVSGDGDDTLWLAIIQAMVAGTFLYVSIVEVGMKELLMCRHSGNNDGGDQSSRKYDMTLKQVEAAKLFFFLVGFLAFSSLAFVI